MRGLRGVRAMIDLARVEQDRTQIAIEEVRVAAYR